MRSAKHRLPAAPRRRQPKLPSIPKTPPTASEAKNQLPRLAYSRDEAAEALGISPSLLEKLIARGRIRTVRAGRRRLIPAEALAEFLRSGDTDS